MHEKPNYEKMPKMGKSKNIARAFAIMVVSPVIALKNISKGRGRTKKVGYNMLDYTLLYSQRVTPEMLKFVKLLIDENVKLTKEHAFYTKVKIFSDVNSGLPELLIKHQIISPNEVFWIGKEGYTPLSRLTRVYQDAFVGNDKSWQEHFYRRAKAWIKLGADPLKDPDPYSGKSALDIAVWGKSLEMTQFFLNQLTPKQIKTSNNRALLTACKTGNLELVKLLTQKGFPWKLEKEKDGYEYTALHTLLAKEANREMRKFRLKALQYFLAKGMDINIKMHASYYTVTPLEWMIETGNDDRKTIRFLLDNGAKVSGAIWRAKYKRKRGYDVSRRLIRMLESYEKK